VNPTRTDVRAGHRSIRLLEIAGGYAWAGVAASLVIGYVGVYLPNGRTVVTPATQANGARLAGETR
jgi:hypothetical protein